MHQLSVLVEVSHNVLKTKSLSPHASRTHVKLSPNRVPTRIRVDPETLPELILVNKLHHVVMHFCIRNV